MKQRLRNHRSVRTYFYLLVFCLLLVFSLIIIFNNISAARLLRERVYANTRDTVQHYADQLDSEVSRLDAWMVSITANDSDLAILRTATFDSTRWHTAIHRLQQSFSTALATNSISALFCYIPNEDYYLISNSGISNATTKNIIKNAGQGDVSMNGWSVQFLEGSWYLVRRLTVRGLTIGAVIRLSDFLNVGTDTRLMLLESGGTLLGPEGIAQQLTPLESDATPGYKIENVSEEKSFIVYVPLAYSDDYLAQIIPYSWVSTESRSFSSIIMIIAAVLLLTLGFIMGFLDHKFMRPLKSITKGINELRAGNLDAYIPDRSFPTEFTEVSSAFNDAVSEIRDLKIDVYERKLQTQNLEMQYLKQQITPHFMINCLNTAYQLTDSDHTDLAREMLSELSEHLRYTLSSGQTVRLSEELNFVRNYLKISDIRYPGSLALMIDCPEDIQNATVVPLMLLNFVENTIKHEVRMGRLLEIHIQIGKTDSRLSVVIWDTGTGFSEESLTYLQNLNPDSFSDSTHIGISNVVIRLVHVFPDASFRFRNREDAGAEIRIDLPYEPTV